MYTQAKENQIGGEHEVPSGARHPVHMMNPNNARNRTDVKKLLLDGEYLASRTDGRTAAGGAENVDRGCEPSDCLMSASRRPHFAYGPRKIVPATQLGIQV